MTPLHYDPKEITFTVGFVPVSGFGADSMLKISRQNPDFESVASLDGQVTRTRKHDRRATLEVTLMQTSHSNSQFTGLLILDRKARNGAGVVPFYVRDRLGLSLHEGMCWITKDPDVEYGSEVAEVAWEFEIAEWIGFIGGN